MKKRILSMFLALAMCLTLCVPAFATEEEITITIGGVEYQQTIDEGLRYTTSTLESAEKVYKSVYDKQANVISIYVTTKGISTMSAAEEPRLVIDLNEAEALLPSPATPMKSCEVLYYSQFMGKYYMYTKWDNGSYELLNDTNPIAFTPANTISSMARKCEAYYSWIRDLDTDGPAAIDTAVDVAVSNAMGTIPLWNEINAVCQIMVNTAKGEDSTDEWLALITSAISALPGLSLFGVVMDIGNVSFHFAFVAEDIFHLNDINKEVYNYYN